MNNNIEAKPAPRSSASCCFHRAIQAKQKITRSIRSGACHLESCPTCGAAAAKEWVAQHSIKGDTIGDRWTAMVISFPRIILPSSADRAAKAECIEVIQRQRAMVEQIKQAAGASTFGDLIGYAGVCHFLSLSASEVRFHLHFGFFPGEEGSLKVMDEIHSMGSMHGFTVEEDERDVSHLLGWLMYLRHPPLESEEEKPGSGFTEEQRHWIEDAIFKPWRNRRFSDRTAYPKLIARFMGGRALRPNRFGWVRARARWAAVMNGGRSMKERVGDPDSKFADYLRPYLRSVRYLVTCPSCREPQFPDALPLKGLVCTECKHRWLDKAVRAGFKAGGEKRRGCRRRLRA